MRDDMPLKQQDVPRASHELPAPVSRIGYSMIKGAEDAGQIQPGKTTLVEPTSGQSSLCALQGVSSCLTSLRWGCLKPTSIEDELCNREGPTLELWQMHGHEKLRHPA